MGIRNRAPNKGEPYVTLHFVNVVNLANVPSNSCMDRHEFVTGERIKFLLKAFTQMLKIHVWC